MPKGNLTIATLGAKVIVQLTEKKPILSNRTWGLIGNVAREMGTGPAENNENRGDFVDWAPSALRQARYGVKPSLALICDAPVA